MKQSSGFINKLKISQVFSAVSSLSVLLIIINVEESKKLIVSIIASILFWLGLIAEQVLVWSANKQRKKLEQSFGYKEQGLPGIVSFFKTKTGKTADLIFAVSTVTYIILLVGNWGENTVQYVFLFLMFLSFRLHCIANGKNYRYIHYLQKRRAKS